MLRYDDIYAPPRAEPSVAADRSDSGTLPALWWVGVLIALVLLRVLYEVAE